MKAPKRALRRLVTFLLGLVVAVSFSYSATVDAGFVRPVEEFRVDLSEGGGSFGGFFRTIGHRAECQIANPKTGSCSCPAGFSSSQVHAFVDRGNEFFCASPGSCAMAVHACFRQPLRGASGGFHRRHADGGCTDANFFTGECACPAGYAEHPLTHLSDEGGRFLCSDAEGGCSVTAYQCIKRDAGGSAGGFYRIHLADGACEDENPVTGACSCPRGYKDRIMDEFHDSERRFFCKAAGSCGVEVRACIR